MTIPTIGELKGNTVLELFNNGYDAIKKGKQDKLVAGDNIVINGNVISAIEGGTPVLEDYYTKEEVNSILEDNYYTQETIDESLDELEQDIQDVANELPDMTQYYDKAEVDALIPNMTNYYTKTEVDALISTSGGIEVINPVLYAQTYGFYFTDEVKSGDIVVVELRGSNDTVIGSFVISYTNNNINNAIAINPGFSLTPDANNYVESYDIASLRYDSTNESYVVLCMTVTKTITNGLSAISHNTRVLSNTNSKVTIYRKAEE